MEIKGEEMKCRMTVIGITKGVNPSMTQNRFTAVVRRANHYTRTEYIL